MQKIGCSLRRYALNRTRISATPLREMPRDRCTNSRLRAVHHFPDAWRATASSILCCLALVTSLRAQEPVRTAAQQLPIQTFRQSPEAFFYLGPFQEILTGALGVAYTDNVGLSTTDKVSDLSYAESLSLNTTWVVSHLNQLQFNFGGQLIENFYGNGKNLVTFAVDPTSKIEFKLAIGDFLVRVYDQFSYTQNPTTDPTATNTANLNSLTNTFGTVVDWDLTLAVLSLSGDLTYNNQSGSTVLGQNNPSTTGTRESFRLGSSLTFRLSPDILYGITGVGTRSTSSDAPGVNSLNLGAFTKGKLSKAFEFDLSAGITLVDTKPHIAPTFYFSAAFRYQVDPHLQLLLSADRDLIFTTGTDLTQENVFKIGAQWGITRAITFSLSPFINFGDVKTTTNTVGINTAGLSTSAQQGNYSQYGIEAGLVWKLRKRWSTGITYDYVRRLSESTSAGIQPGAKQLHSKFHRIFNQLCVLKVTWSPSPRTFSGKLLLPGILGGNSASRPSRG